MYEKRNMIRHGTLNDISDLVALEQDCFDSDIITRRQFRHMLTKANADLMVFEENQQVMAYVLMLYSRGTQIARLYSIAVSYKVRKRGIGQLLVQAAESAARRRFCKRIRLEIRKDNQNSINLFQRAGYRQFGEHSAYYEDRMDAMRLEKVLPFFTEVELDANENTSHQDASPSSRIAAG